jgi:hypothetical protein
MIDPDWSPREILAATVALSHLRFYQQHYTVVAFHGLGGGKRITLGKKPFKCRFCDKESPAVSFKKRAHAVSELLGNKIMTSLYECDSCNGRFQAFEDDLAKMTLAARSMSGVRGKKGSPTLVGTGRGPVRMKAECDGLHLSHDAGAPGFIEDPINKTLALTYDIQPHRPLGAYKALCKSAFTLLPDDEVTHFRELKSWLLQSDLTTCQVYSSGSHFCYSTVLPTFKPFKQPIVCLLKRKRQIDAPYMLFFIATGNFTYQISLPCPEMDDHLRGKAITVLPYPHYYQLQPWLVPKPIVERLLELSSAERTKQKTDTITWTFGSKVQVL